MKELDDLIHNWNVSRAVNLSGPVPANDVAAMIRDGDRLSGLVQRLNDDQLYEVICSRCAGSGDLGVRIASGWNWGRPKETGPCPECKGAGHVLAYHPRGIKGRANDMLKPRGDDSLLSVTPAGADGCSGYKMSENFTTYDWGDSKPYVPPPPYVPQTVKNGTNQTLFKIWKEGWSGHVAQGEYEHASIVGYAQGETFEDAVRAYYAAHPAIDHTGHNHFDEKRLTHWGCRHFPTEAEARKSFG